VSPASLSYTFSFSGPYGGGDSGGHQEGGP
jgi:hypothetical protein